MRLPLYAAGIVGTLLLGVACADPTCCKCSYRGSNCEEVQEFTNDEGFGESCESVCEDPPLESRCGDLEDAEEC